jgi:hypothetical protein
MALFAMCAALRHYDSSGDRIRRTLHPTENSVVTRRRHRDSETIRSRRVTKQLCATRWGTTPHMHKKLTPKPTADYDEFQGNLGLEISIWRHA